MNFDESVNYLYSLGNEVVAMKLGLENPKKLLRGLGNPETNYRKVQIAGTNGKGSTCAFLDAICRSAGIKTGLYTSPHLVSVTERIRIDGTDIPEEEFALLATTVRETTENAGLYATFFEQMTAIALLAFAEAKVDLAILETGLGGRLDATTAASAEIVAITPIDYDHQQYLGETLAEIAAEKAAIIRSDTPVIVAPQKPEVERVIEAKCREAGVTPVRVNGGTVEEFDESRNEPNLLWNFPTEKHKYRNIELSLAGAHQATNAAVAVGLAEALRGSGFPITDEDIANGLKNAVHPGRLELVGRILLDGAHNIAGAEALRAYLQEKVSLPVTLIFGAMRDKQITEIAQILFPLADKLILTKPDNPRAAAPADLAALARSPVLLADDIADALTLAREYPENLTCISGSLYLVGEARNLLTQPTRKWQD